ncbi:terminase small subunit [Hymenobacter metallicola]|uniref:Terminase small subunit n=1 Tax=Hymenobacter metallicola TaxID=2563114 RepID=A0A4Z0QLW2_9BACT|nr:terminase small subunit [Hymenobacter metallicola]TGE29722.1 terminase small subunit [Hymenobacter metallicola]
MSTSAEKTAFQKLTPKQKAFVNAICADPNISATAAALKAGYTGTGVRVEAHRLLTNANIRKAFGEKLKDVGPSTEEIAHRWDRVSRASLDDFYTLKLVEVENKVPQHLSLAIEQEQEAIAYERAYAPRAAQVLGYQGEELSQYMDKSEGKVRRMQLRILEWEMALERNPEATRLVDGPQKFEERLELDLVKAQKLGVLDLAKSIKETTNGTGLEMRDVDGALDKLARIKGAYEKDNEQSRAVAVINTKTEIINTGPPIARSEKDIDDV